MIQQRYKKRRKYNLSIVFVTLMILYNISLSGQVLNNGLLHVGMNGLFSLHGGDFSFGTFSETTSNKTFQYNIMDGKIMLGSGVSFSTDGSAMRFVDGYAGTFNTSETLLAIGSGSTFAPIKVTAISNVSGVYAAYFDTPPVAVFGGGMDPVVATIVDTEYWIIKGESARISLSWNSGSGLNALTYADVSIIGFKNGIWEVVDSVIDDISVFGGTSDLSVSGSISSIDIVNFSEYSAFALGEKGVACFSTVIPSGFTKTWNGSSWSPSAPNISDTVVLMSDYNNTSFECYSLELGSNNISLSNDQTLEVVNDITGSGSIIMTDNASLVQHNGDVNVSKPNIELTRTTRAIKRYDYVYWGSPVSENVFSQLDSNAIASGQLTTGAFDLKYKYVSGVMDVMGGWQNLNSTELGKGFIMRVKQQAPFVDAITEQTIQLTFKGTANNGDIIVPVTKVLGNDISARNNNLLANPYPSAIDADKFLTENNDLIDGVIYLWRASTSNITGNASYTNADYIAYTRAGTTAITGVGNVITFNGKIASGQGFKVRALTSGDVRFTNCMRLVNENSQFLRVNVNTNSFNSTNSNVNRFKLNLQSTEGVFNQILIAYLPQATLLYDNMYDAQLLSLSQTTIFSILDNTTKKLAINARPHFENTDQVNLGFTKDASIITPMSIDVIDKEGIFANNVTPIYLYDSLLNIYHDFTNGPYTFSTTITNDSTRFKLVYQTNILNNNDYENAITSVYLKDNRFVLTSSKDVFNIQIFDISGRIITTLDINNNRSVNEYFLGSSTIYFAKITFSDGSVTSKKILNQ